MNIKNDILTLSESIDNNNIIKKQSNELELGIKIEKEHKKTYDMIKEYYKKNNKFPDERVVFESIAKEHIAEFDNYYSALIYLEKKLKNKEYIFK